MSGLPAAAFAIGGITQWLTDGVNGFVAPARPATAAGLADAIAKCLCDPSVYRRLRSGARSEAKKFSLDRHIGQLAQIFDQVAVEQPTETQTAWPQ
jgi:glycosyltransferase involved in cell wall biosynthesis